MVPPGVGKSEFARLLGVAIGAQLYEVSHADEDGDPLGGRARFSSFMLCQRILANSGDSVVLFDEIEDVFPSEGMGLLRLFGIEGSGGRSAGKAWVNRTLENNPVPAIWISNDVDQIDPAYLRRYDYALEMPKPPQAARQRIAAKYLGATQARSGWIERVAAWDELTPAQLEKAARVARLATSGSAADAEGVAERVLRHSARLLGQGTPPPLGTGAGYSLAYLNTSLELAPLIEGLRRRPRATFCFHGPPGTGKTALARHVADAVGRPLRVKRASDLLSKWVGQAEQNIAAMFREAAQDGAVLVLDEADGLLAERRGAVRSWEVTPVNEMLTQMEDFDGIFICTTNLLERLDTASLRRFAFKVHFGYLQPEQRIALFRETWARLDGEAGDVPQTLPRRLERLDNLTPGDFAVVMRQRAVLGAGPTVEAFVSALEEECRIKGGTSQPMGFLA